MLQLHYSLEMPSNPADGSFVFLFFWKKLYCINSSVGMANMEGGREGGRKGGKRDKSESYLNHRPEEGIVAMSKKDRATPTPRSMSAVAFTACLLRRLLVAATRLNKY